VPPTGTIEPQASRGATAPPVAPRTGRPWPLRPGAFPVILAARRAAASAPRRHRGAGGTASPAPGARMRLPAEESLVLLIQSMPSVRALSWLR
jgi:hypothetical protein